MEEERRQQFHCIQDGIILCINSLSTSLPTSLKHMVRAITTHENPLTLSVWYSTVAQCCAVTQNF